MKTDFGLRQRPSHKETVRGKRLEIHGEEEIFDA
jgi:hypothetical protein